MVASTGCSFFIFQGKPFIFEKTADGQIKIRCLWGSAKPIKALLRHVQESAKARDKVLRDHFVRGCDRYAKVIENRKRTLSSIDMAPDVKQDILTSLQDYFDPETEEWCFQNGAPYRKGLMLYGPPGTGKSSLCMAIASEFNLPIYYFQLMDMDDRILHDEFQKLPKRRMVLFEEIDTAGIVRTNTMNAEKKEADDETNSREGTRNAEEEETDDGNKTRNKNTKKAKTPKLKTEPRPSEVTFGGLLNAWPRCKRGSSGDLYDKFTELSG